MLIRFRMSLIKGEIEPEHHELFALKFGKIELYTLELENLPYLTV